MFSRTAPILVSVSVSGAFFGSNEIGKVCYTSTNSVGVLYLRTIKMNFYAPVVIIFKSFS